MRIISQDGMIDVPYDMSIVNIDYRDKKRIVATIAGCGEIENLCQMATYSTEAKAIKAIEMLRDQYMQYATARSDDYWFAFNNPKVFQFPKDEEIEVEE